MIQWTLWQRGVVVWENLLIQCQRGCNQIIFIYLKTLFHLLTYPAIAAPIGIEIGGIDILAGLTITVPSTNGANPGRNLYR